MLNAYQTASQTTSQVSQSHETKSNSRNANNSGTGKFKAN